MSPVCRTRPDSIGVWVDHQAPTVNKPAYWEWLRTLGIDEASVMIDSARAGWDSRWSVEDCRKAGNLAKAHGIKVGLIVWPDPNKDMLEEMEAELLPRVEAMQAFEIEDDLEWNWRRSRMRGFSSMREASTALVQSRRRLTAATGAHWAMSTFTSHIENSSRAQVAPHVDRLCVQAYSVRTRKNAKGADWQVGVDHALGPRKMAATTLNRTAAIPGVKEGRIEVVCGLAAYDQAGFPGMAPEVAMGTALQSASSWSAGPVQISGARYWSTKNLRINDYAREFLLSLS